jgi:hypothetical protein
MIRRLLVFGCSSWIARCWAALAGALLLQPALACGSGLEPGPQAGAPGASLVLVVGAEGTPEYGRNFNVWADHWAQAAAAGGVSVTLIGRDDDQTISDRERLQQVLAGEVQTSEHPLWLVLIGHGTFDGREARFNLRGEDVSATELADWLQHCRRPLAVINCASSSAPFIDRLAGPERIIVTATKSGAEVNFSRFGDYLSQAIADLSADLDKDGQVSLLEAFLQASRQTQAYYDGQRLLATEQALLDDNGDARGVRADFFSGLQPTTQAEGGEALDGLRAHQWHLVPSAEERRLPEQMRQRRNELELQLAALRERKQELDEDVYYARIEPVLLEIAELYAAVDENEDSQPQLDRPTEVRTEEPSSKGTPAPAATPVD